MHPPSQTFCNFFDGFFTHKILHELTILIVCVVNSHRKQFIRVGCLPHITHISLSWTISVAVANRKQFVWVNRMPYITHTLIWLIVYVALPNSKRFIRANCMSYIAPHWYGCPFLLFCLIANSSNGLTVCPESHTQLKPEPCLMAPPSQTFCTFFDSF